MHSLSVAATAAYRAEATSLHFDALQSWSGQLLVPAAQWQLALAHAGLLPDADLLCYPKDAPYTRITLQRLVPAPSPCEAIRLATAADLPALLELESQWDSAELRASEAALLRRIALHPSGQYVAIGPAGEPIAAMYTQRVVSSDALTTATRQTESALHAAEGGVVQLLGVVAHPSAASVGSVLRWFVLRQAQLSGFRRVCGVTRCRDWVAGGALSYSEHVREATTVACASTCLRARGCWGWCRDTARQMRPTRATAC